MKRRFVVTLLAVAIAAIGTMAQAMAPTIDEIPSPIIADGLPTDSNVFVYPDALNLDDLATDDSVANTEIIWSYTGSGKYMINGVDPLDPGTEDPTVPGAKRIDNANNDTDFSPDTSSTEDGNARTITFRNVDLSPIGGPMVAENTLTSGILDAETEVVTLFASDGTTFSSESFLVYTENNGVDRLSGNLATGEVIYEQSFNGNAGALGWTSASLLGTTTLTDDANGMCIGVPAGGQNWGEWVSPYGIVEFAKNKVYKLDLTIDGTTDIAAGATPFWDLLVQQFNDDDILQQEQRFSTDYIVLDLEGGANSAGLANGRNDYQVWFNPPMLLASDWNDNATGVFTAARVGNQDNGLRFSFRILDLNDSIGASGDAGTLCLSAFKVTGYDYDDLSVQGAVNRQDTAGTGYNITDVNLTNFVVTNLIPGSTSSTAAGGDVTINPTSTWNPELITVEPGDGVIDLGNPASLPDSYPVTWESDQLLRVKATIAGSSATTNTNPPDAISIGADTATNELIMTNTMGFFVDTLGAPKNGTPQDYVSFFYTHSATSSTVQNADGIRPRLLILCNESISGGGSAGLTVNQGGVTVSAVDVDPIAQP